LHFLEFLGCGSCGLGNKNVRSTEHTIELFRYEKVKWFSDLVTNIQLSIVHEKSYVVEILDDNLASTQPIPCTKPRACVCRIPAARADDACRRHRSIFFQ